MEVYYKTRENKYLFDAQKNFAQAMGRKFLNMKKELEKKNNERESIDKNEDENILRINNNEILYIKEESVESDRKDNALDAKTKDENEEKEQKEIANMYNNPNFMEIGCTMQLYQQVQEEKLKKDIIENDGEDKKQIILLGDQI